MFSEKEYDRMIGDLFVRFPSFQKDGTSAYKPGIAGMEFFDSLNGHPHTKYKTIHVAGTNGKGSVCSMLASILASAGYRVGLYTSPHLLDFRERMRIIDGRCWQDSGAGPRRHACAPELYYIEKKEVWDFLRRWGETFDHLDLSFFEITTSMAFDWFASRNVDVAVIETGLGGRLDSTNIISPVMSIITNIGLDHCDMLGNTLSEIAFEKAGIIKPAVPAVVGESSPETDPVFDRKVLYSNLSVPEYMACRTRIMSLLVYADKTVPACWDRDEALLERMDLKGEYQEKNLRTVLAAADMLRRILPGMLPDDPSEAIEHAAVRTGFHGRWETVCSSPRIICDIGHNAHGLKYNFHQLAKMLAGGECSSLTVMYGTVSDKDYESVFPLMPDGAAYVFTNASGRRACPASAVMEKYIGYCEAAGRGHGNVFAEGSVAMAMEKAVALAVSAGGAGCPDKTGGPMIYVGGSTYVVSEALVWLEEYLKRIKCE